MAQNTISDELNRLIQAKADIKSALEEKGLTIGDSSTLDEFPGLIQEMEVGGGSDTSTIIDLIEGDITSLEIPYGTTKIKSGLFKNCGLVDVSIPDTVTRIEAQAFQNSSISKLYTKVNYIGAESFNTCINLNELIFQNSVNIDNNAIMNDTSFNQIVFLSNKPGSLGTNALMTKTYPRTIPTIYVIHDYVQTYKSAFGWSNYTDYITPLAAINYDASTYTVTALGRDNLELYIDASLCNSSVYTFDSTTQTGNHTVMVKSVDPSLGVLDTVSQEITI